MSPWRHSPRTTERPRDSLLRGAIRCCPRQFVAARCNSSLHAARCCASGLRVAQTASSSGDPVRRQSADPYPASLVAPPAFRRLRHRRPSRSTSPRLARCAASPQTARGVAAAATCARGCDESARRVRGSGGGAASASGSARRRGWRGQGGGVRVCRPPPRRVPAGGRLRTPSAGSRRARCHSRNGSTRRARCQARKPTCRARTERF